MGRFVLIVLLCLLVPIASLAQGDPEAPAPSEQPAPADDVPVKETPAVPESPAPVQAAPPAEPATGTGVISREEFDALQSELTALQEQVDATEEARMAELGGGEFEPSIDVYGFMAVYGGKWFVPKDNPLRGVMNTNFSLGVTDMNVYFAGRITESLETLLELRFSFLPHGSDEFPSLARMDTTVVNANTTEEFVFGGTQIERAQFTWQPRDFIGITVGRFLTPFGIWNIDHGAPVVIPVNQPYIILRHLMPLAQTGLHIHGKVFPLPAFSLEYGFTVANGRGPSDALYDLDKNKALGLRLRGRYEVNNDVEVTLGGYGYIGKYTNDVRQLDVTDLAVRRDVTEQYKEFAASADLLVRLWGVRIQSEWAGAIIKYTERPLSTIPLLEIPNPGQLQPDYIHWDVYVMLAYEWNFKTRFGGMRLTPFVMGERDIMFDNEPSYDTWVLRFGVNFKPHPRLVLKVDSTGAHFPDNDILTDVWSVGGQASVVF